MELRRPDQVLIDKLTLGNIYCKDILRYNELVEDRIVIYWANDRLEPLITGVGEKYHTLSVPEEKGLFKSFFLGYTRRGIFFSKMELTAGGADEYGNLNVLTVDEYKARIDLVKAFLEQKYGIILDFSEVEVQYIELAKTSALEFLYHRYANRVIPYIMRNITCERFGGLIRYDGDASKDYPVTNTFCRTTGKTGRDFKMYNKSVQLRSLGIKVKGEYLRTEYILKAKTSVVAHLGTAKLKELTDEKVTEVFEAFIRRRVEEAHINDLERCHMTLKRLIKRNYKCGSHSWIQNVLTELEQIEQKRGYAAIFNIEEIINAIDIIKFKNRQSKSNAKKRIQKIASQYYTQFTMRDNELFEEIVSKIR